MFTFPTPSAHVLRLTWPTSAACSLVSWRPHPPSPWLLVHCPCMVSIGQQRWASGRHIALHGRHSIHQQVDKRRLAITRDSLAPKTSKNWSVLDHSLWSRYNYRRGSSYGQCSRNPRQNSLCIDPDSASFWVEQRMLGKWTVPCFVKAHALGQARFASLQKWDSDIRLGSYTVLKQTKRCQIRET